MSYEPSHKIGGLTEEEMVRFLAEPWNARIATLDPDGWPYVTPVWYDFDPARRCFHIVGRERAEWVDHIRRHQKVALHVADDLHVQHTRVLAQGQAAILEGPVAPASSAAIRALTERMSLRYLGPNGPAYAAKTAGRPRVLVRITPTRMRTWTGQEWHPRYR